MCDSVKKHMPEEEQPIESFMGEGNRLTEPTQFASPVVTNSTKSVSIDHTKPITKLLIRVSNGNKQQMGNK